MFSSLNHSELRTGKNGTRHCREYDTAAEMNLPLSLAATTIGIRHYFKGIKAFPCAQIHVVGRYLPQSRFPRVFRRYSTQIASFVRHNVPNLDRRSAVLASAAGHRLREHRGHLLPPRQFSSCVRHLRRFRSGHPGGSSHGVRIHFRSHRRCDSQHERQPPQ